MIRITEVVAEYKDLEDLTKRHNYVGFTNEYGNRYMLVSGGAARGLAVHSRGTWASKKEQAEYTEGYKIFDTEDELLDWMKSNDY